MAVIDDLNRLAQQDVAYLTRILIGSRGGEDFPGKTIIFRGRLRQALNGNWVFNTSTGQNGVAGIILGPVQDNWSSSESPAVGLQITVTTLMPPQGPVVIDETITLTSVIPQDLAD
jgi:hypothetical protein